MKRTKSKYSVTFKERSGRYSIGGSYIWTNSRKLNLIFLLHVQAMANDKLRSRYIVTPDGEIVQKGYLYLNEVFDMIGMPRTMAGQVVGWIYEENNQIGDNFVSFDINPRGTNPNVVLDFNVDGNIFEKLYVA